MNRKWIFVVFCLIVIIILCEAGDKGKAKKKSKAQIEKEKKKTARPAAATEDAATTAAREEKRQGIGKQRSKKNKREVRPALIQTRGPYVGSYLGPYPAREEKLYAYHI